MYLLVQAALAVASAPQAQPRDPFGGWLTTMLVTVVLAMVAARLLGIVLSWRRTLVTGWLGLVTAWLFYWLATGPGHLAHMPAIAAFMVGVAGSVVAIVLSELVIKTRPAMDPSARSSTLGLNPLAALADRYRRARRYAQVVRIFARHGLTSLIHSPARASRPGRLGHISARPSRRPAAFTSSSGRRCHRAATCSRPR